MGWPSVSGSAVGSLQQISRSEELVCWPRAPGEDATALPESPKFEARQLAELSGRGRRLVTVREEGRPAPAAAAATAKPPGL